MISQNAKSLILIKPAIKNNGGGDQASATSPVYQILGMKQGRMSTDILNKLYAAPSPQEMLDLLKANEGNLRGTARPGALPSTEPAARSDVPPTALPVALPASLPDVPLAVQPIARDVYYL